jgi:uncharacterized protein YndB with AHSA1/START domain
MTTTSDYTETIQIGAPAEKVFDTLTSTTEFAAWWAPATGSGTEGGELSITFEGIEDPIVMSVREASRPSVVSWEVTACAFLPDWVGTTPRFTSERSAAGGCAVGFRHEGLNASLECFEMCRAGWDQYLPSLRAYLETGTGEPFTPARLG